MAKNNTICRHAVSKWRQKFSSRWVLRKNSKKLSYMRTFQSSCPSTLDSGDWWRRLIHWLMTNWPCTYFYFKQELRSVERGICLITALCTVVETLRRKCFGWQPWSFKVTKILWGHVTLARPILPSFDIQGLAATKRRHFYRAMHFSAKRGIGIACRPSVCPSVRDVGGSTPHSSEILETNYTNN